MPVSWLIQADHFKTSRISKSEELVKFAEMRKEIPKQDSWPN